MLDTILAAISDSNVLLVLFIFAAILFVISLVWLILLLRKPTKESKKQPPRSIPPQPAPADRSTQKLAPEASTSPGAAVSKPLATAFLTLEDAAGKVFALDPLPAALGRDPQKNKIVINDTKVSGAHAKIYYDNLLKAICIEDTNSLNGLFVDEAPTLKNILYNGAKVRLGETVFTFRDHGYIHQS